MGWLVAVAYLLLFVVVGLMTWAMSERHLGLTVICGAVGVVLALGCIRLENWLLARRFREGRDDLS